ncbi:MAG: membrane dipeptidase [Anaerolineae bacterium]|nr:membrane dipeptidase [Anaerolineae bacterium]
MLIADSHLDLAWNALQWNRDLRQSVYTIRNQERGLKVINPGNGLGVGTVALPELRRGRVALSFATLLVRATGRMVPNMDYLSVAQAYGIARGQLAYYRELAAEGLVRLVTDAATLDQHMAEWEAWDAAARADATSTPPLGFVIAMESADPIPAPDRLIEFWEEGVRVIGPAHYGPGRYAGGTGTELGLTDLGVALLREMEQLGIILDLTHFSDQAFWQALERFDGQVLASHNNCRALVPAQRQFSDEQIRAIIARNGVIGVMLDVAMLQLGWTSAGGIDSGVPLIKVLDHIDHICQLAGDAQHVGIGSDLDGGFGREQSPNDLDTIADLPRIADLLAARGYAATDIARIMYGNWVALLRRAWS